MDQIHHMDPSPHTNEIPHVDQIPQKDQSPHMNIIVLTTSVSQGKAKDYGYVHYSSNHYVINPQIIYLLIHMLTLTPLMRNKVDWHLCHRSLMELAE